MLLNLWSDNYKFAESYSYCSSRHWGTCLNFKNAILIHQFITAFQRISKLSSILQIIYAYKYCNPLETIFSNISFCENIGYWYYTTKPNSYPLKRGNSVSSIWQQKGNKSSLWHYDKNHRHASVLWNSLLLPFPLKKTNFSLRENIRRLISEEPSPLER